MKIDILCEGKLKKDLENEMCDLYLNRISTLKKSGISKVEIKKITDQNKVIYQGQADDIEGEASGSISGNTLNWSYDIYLNIKGSNIKVHFNDWIYKQSEDLAINRAYVSKFGINIGSVTLVFLRGKTAAQIGPLNLKSW